MNQPLRLPANSQDAGSGSACGPVSRRSFFASMAVLFPAARVLQGQFKEIKPAPEKPVAEKDGVFSTDVKLVNLFATVHDKKGQIIRDLAKDDFTIDEDGRPQVIKHFSRESDLALTLGLLVDTSGSQRRLLGDEKRATRKFITQVLREGKDMTFLIHFDREVELMQDLTSSKLKLEDALDSIEGASMGRPQWGGRGGQGGQGGGGQGGPGGLGGRGYGGGGTLLYDSVLLASDDLMKKQKGRKALILLTDGEDHGSKVTLDESISSAQRADTMVYSILFADKEGGGFSPGRGGLSTNIPGLGGGRRGGGGGQRPRQGAYDHPDGKKVLQRLSKETGGSFFEVSKKLPIDKVFDSIEEELRNQYSFGYTSDRPAGSGYRQIHVAANRKDAVVQTREGYYADR